MIYQHYIKPGCDEEYRRLWSQIASYFVERRGAIGSCLHRRADGLWLAYSRWPDKATRDASWPGDDAPSDVLPEEIRHAIIQIKNLVDDQRKIPDLCLDVVDDRLLNQGDGR